MTNAKIDFSVGNLNFSAEGTESWLSAQLDKVIDAAPALGQLNIAAQTAADQSGEKEGGLTTTAFTTTLASHIKAKGGDTNQVKRFLAAADWLRQKGSNPLSTSAVTKALSSNHQKKLANPADCLNKLVSKGYCEKHGDGFFITPDGLNDLGY